MDINLYCPHHDNELITFTFINSVNSVVIFVYSLTNNKIGVPLTYIKTKLVSGYEKKNNKINMNMVSVSNDLMGHSKLDGYIISCIRLPYVCHKLVKGNNLAAPLCVTVMQTRHQIEIWHVFGVKKLGESKKIKKICGVYIDENGHNVFHKKDLICVRGNIAACFIKSLSQPVTNGNDINIATIVNSELKCNNGDVTIVFT
ncbi:early 23kD protein [Ectropis obliqua nucleopolyhedrovirus]|uniref:Early 23kD protein n=1 Tax=Ectropis obliqua nucleopolyhedrovirus TaxID=59376 RepID=A0EYR0_9ABAC|nr:early 23kD protein [Ectropis obliqua nucleopolyhedrovirus]ABI35691.1 early 23kD protein [Ectropis obliqua nucleopolyhedrovirus]AGS47874.1 putative 22.9 kDa protein [Ectropis obliqua nucleopolyhedrovirus]QWV59593.1 early 23kD protein [Ectropis obliqua nucleopolyhedrovirus]UYO72799.1 early 23kD protein [Ectropis obliqua nucleopolyhedrovirus]